MPTDSLGKHKIFLLAAAPEREIFPLDTKQLR